jgi:peptide/nickel transport system substrate-binding protein
MPRPAVPPARTPRRASLALLAAIAALVASAALGGCRRGFPDQPADSPTVRVGVNAPVGSFRLAHASDLAVARFVDLAFEGLTEADPSGTIRPALAARWDVTRDARTFRFHLRQGVRFHDGTPFGAGDVVRTWELALREPPGSATHPYMLDAIEGAGAFSRGEAPHVAGLRVADDSTLEVRLDQPLGLFPALLSLQPTYVGARASGDRRPLGTGPWRWVRGAPGTGEEIWLARFDGYWDARPALDSVVIRVVPDSLQLAAFRSHWIDYADPVAPQARLSVSASPEVGYLEAPGDGLTRLVINMRVPELQDVRVRRALNHAIDVERLVSIVADRAIGAAAGAIPPRLSGADPHRVPYAFDPARARRLLREGGYPMTRPLRVYARTPGRGPYRSQVGHLVRDYLEGVGLQVEYHEDADVEQMMAENRADLTLETWAADYADGDAMLYPLFYGHTAGTSGNLGGFHDPVVDSLVDAERRETDPARRAELLRAADARVHDQAGNVFLWFTRTATAYSMRLRGWEPTTYTTRYQSLRLAGAATERAAVRPRATDR